MSVEWKKDELETNQVREHAGNAPGNDEDDDDDGVGSTTKDASGEFVIDEDGVLYGRSRWMDVLAVSGQHAFCGARPVRNWGSHCMRQLWLEVGLLRRHWCWAVAFVLALWIHLICARFVFWIYNETETYRFTPLWDVLIDGIFPNPDFVLMETIRNGFYYTVLISGMATGLSPFLIRQRYVEGNLSRKPFVLCGVHILVRVAQVYIFGAVTRCTSFLITILPSPGPWCQLPQDGGTYDPQTSPPRTALEFLFDFSGLEAGCGDLIYSGHTLICLLLVLVVHAYCCWWAWKVLMWLLFIPFCITHILALKHYTVDVWIAVYLVPLLWSLAHRMQIFSQSADEELVVCALAYAKQRERRGASADAQSEERDELETKFLLAQIWPQHRWPRDDARWKPWRNHIREWWLGWNPYGTQWQERTQQLYGAHSVAHAEYDVVAHCASKDDAADLDAASDASIGSPVSHSSPRLHHHAAAPRTRDVEASPQLIPSADLGGDGTLEALPA